LTIKRISISIPCNGPLNMTPHGMTSQNTYRLYSFLCNEIDVSDFDRGENRTRSHFTRNRGPAQFATPNITVPSNRRVSLASAYIKPTMKGTHSSLWSSRWPDLERQVKGSTLDRIQSHVLRLKPSPAGTVNAFITTVVQVAAAATSSRLLMAAIQRLLKDTTGFAKENGERRREISARATAPTSMFPMCSRQRRRGL
jgi:hypothetical protein